MDFGQARAGSLRKGPIMKYSKKQIDEAISYWEKRLHEADGSSSPDKVREDAVRLAYA